MRHPRRLRLEQHLVAHPEDRQHHNGEKHDAQSAYPVRETPPKQHPVGKRLDVVEHRSARRGEARHRFKKSVRQQRDAPAGVERHHPESGEEQPRKGHDAIAVPARHHVLGSAPQSYQHASHPDVQQRRTDEVDVIVLTVEQCHPHAHQEQHCLYEKQNAQNPENHLPVEQAVFPFSGHLNRCRPKIFHSSCKKSVGKIKQIIRLLQKKPPFLPASLADFHAKRRLVSIKSALVFAPFRRKPYFCQAKNARTE